jgi:hypothetical protein
LEEEEEEEDAPFLDEPLPLVAAPMIAAAEADDVGGLAEQELISILMADRRELTAGALAPYLSASWMSLTATAAAAEALRSDRREAGKEMLEEVEARSSLVRGEEAETAASRSESHLATFFCSSASSSSSVSSSSSEPFPTAFAELAAADASTAGTEASEGEVESSDVATEGIDDS